MSLLDGQPVDRRPGDAPHHLRNALHALLGFGGPADALLGTDIQLGVLESRRQQHVAGADAHEVLGVAAQPGILLGTVHSDATNDQQPGVDLPHVVEDLLECLAVKKCALVSSMTALAEAIVLCNREMGLVDLSQTAVSMISS